VIVAHAGSFAELTPIGSIIVREEQMTRRRAVSVLQQIAYYQNRRDEAPNQALARALAETQDRAGVAEIAQNLWNANPAIQSDCVKVLYELGAIEPELIAGYAEDFLKLLGHKNNRLVWGGMTALAAIAPLRAAELFEHWPTLRQATEAGSVITADNGIKALAAIATSGDAPRQAIFPYLLQHLAACRPKDVPQRAEKIAVAVNASNRQQFSAALEQRMDDLSPTQAGRVKRVIKQVIGI
jgi:hypothetical protein